MNHLLRLATVAVVVAAPARAAGPQYTDAESAGPDFSVQGEYAGSLRLDGESRAVGVQVIAEGKGMFHAVVFAGGLPGDGWDRERRFEVPGKTEEGKLVFQGEVLKGVVQDGAISVQRIAGDEVGRLKRVIRLSPTLGQKPPEGAVVLFDGSGTDQWKHGRMTEDGLLRQGTTSVATFGSHRLHIEFQLPFQPLDRGQARGNSGIYLQGRYEVQMLDSFGLEGRDNECGGIYSIKAPDLNMCYPPLSWQTYDIEFHAAQFDDQGAMQSLPRITVQHNGVVIHENVELPKSTTAAPLMPGPDDGPVYLQDHGCPVRYRNIWVVAID